ncbi:T9SS-dependent choice-of-anchor J family protein [Chryseobacterium sp. IHB B 17019]|uniref:T9SS-dependent choice-of-anchor J family protein n=1 Tax=Chryseobacterium sp. IHB B 17019 TaxID=1721091 RepID=UPI0009E7E69B|nr:T9SS type A sorting domain-containing protein [Chryseobacterium sp. IHB B 17019]
MMKSLLLFGALAAAAVSLNAQTTIFNETFQTSSGTLAPGWAFQNLNNSTSSVGWRSQDETASTDPMGFSGDTAGSGGSDLDNLLISPSIVLPASSSTLTYKVAAFESSAYFTPIIANNTYMVYVLPASSTFTSTLTPVLTETITTGNTAITKTIDLSSFAGQAVKLYFRHLSTAFQILILDDVNVTSSMVLGTSETSNKEQVGIYPNPATDFITIKSKSEIISTEVYDATGRKVSSQPKSDKVDVRNLLPGSYILNVNTKEGKTSSKFIKKN